MLDMGIKERQKKVERAQKIRSKGGEIEIKLY
jgi:hypothetical protein